jgi:hypothetical protein
MLSPRTEPCCLRPTMVLIQIPEIRTRRAEWPGLRSTGDSPVRKTRLERPRRRLRREIRLAGCVLLALMIMGLAVNCWWTSQPGWLLLAAHVSTRPGPTKLADPKLLPGRKPPLNQLGGSVVSVPSLTLSIEPLATTPSSDSEIPVVFPGYVLPDDNIEEPPHEGS